MSVDIGMNGQQDLDNNLPVFEGPITGHVGSSKPPVPYGYNVGYMPGKKLGLSYSLTGHEDQ